MLKVAIIIAAIALLGWVELGWLSQADIDNQKAVTANILKELPNELAMIDAGMQSSNSPDFDVAVADFQNSFAELKNTPYAMSNYANVISELQNYADSLGEQIVLAKELNALRASLLTSTNDLKKALNKKKVAIEALGETKSVLANIKKRFPNAKNEFVKQTIGELEKMAETITNAVASVAYCLGSCPASVLSARMDSLERAFTDASGKAKEFNGKIAEQLGSARLIKFLTKDS